MLTVLLAATLLTRPALVEKVVDGDTIRVAGHGTIRLLGVDTPETKHPTKGVQPCGREASIFTRDWLTGQHVTLEWEGGKPSRDRYGRALAYVRLKVWGRSSRTFNRLLIEQGYSPAYVRFPFRRRAEFVAAEGRARDKALGVWAHPPCGDES